MHRAVAAILLLLAAGADTGPAGSNPDLAFRCSATCEEGSGMIAYEVGSTYSYEYRADSVTSLSGIGDEPRQDEEARLHVSATADITVLSPCEFSLQVRDAMLEESAPKDGLQRTPAARHREFSEGVSAHALRFSFQDGRVSHACASGSDQPWALNFKRGLLSAFQTSAAQRSLLETDVSGVCETQYRVASSNASTVVLKKTKNLRSCSNRVQHFLSLPSSSYSSPAKSLPLIRSEQSCEQTVSAGQLTRSSCEETHLFRPFSNGGNGAVTFVTQLLVFSDVTRHDGPEPTVETPTRTSLLFHHPASTATPGEASVQEVVATLEYLAREMVDGVRADTPHTFSRLVQSLKAMDHARLANVFHLAQDFSARKFFLDAMPLVSTSDSMLLMVELLSSGEISQREGDSWLQSLTFQARPTLDMLQALLPLVAGQPRPKTMLAVSSLVHGYCTANADCQDELQVRTIVSRLEELLGQDCRTSTRQAEDLVLHALKAIGNAGVLLGSPDTLRRCYQTNNSMEVRLAAVSAHRRLPCDEAASSHLLYTYSDIGEDTEVRIAAYLVAMRCPTEHTIQRIKDTLYSEDVSQVASFVWTHLTNLQETSNPSKHSIKELIANDFLHNKFSTDVRKFSRNYEASVFSEALNFGGTAESNVVFSPGSYLPRSANLNLTVDLFGEAVNIIELGGRAEGFENYIESIFTPGGLFPDKSLRNLLQKLRKDSEKDKQEMSNSIGQKTKDSSINTRIPKPPTVSLYTRIFGNELKYSHFNGLEDISESLGKFADAKDLLSKLLTNSPIDYSKSLVFVDASYVIPTLAGFPLEFTVNGSATVGLKVAGHVDIGGMWTKGNVDIKGHVMPSLTVEFSGMMSVDAFASRAGILSVSRLHSNTLVDGKLKVRGRKLVEMKVNVPRDKMEILEVSSQLLLVRGNQGDEKLQEIKGVQKDREERKWCTSGSISTVTGMQVCTELSYPNATSVPSSPYFPLTGPFIFRTWLEKTDSFNSYDLSYHSSSTPSEKVYQFSADTPGSRINRRLKFLYVLNTRDTAAKLNLIVPGFKLEASGKIENTAKSKGFDVSVVLNDNKVVETTGIVQISQTDKLSRYQSSFFLTVMNKKLFDITGRVHHVDGPKFSADLVATGITSEPILISGDVAVDEDGVDFEAFLNSSLVNGSMYVDLRQAGSSVGAKAGFNYVFPNTAEHSVDFSAKALATHDGPFTTRSASVSLHSTRQPQYDVDTAFNWQADAGGVELSAKFLFGDMDWQARYTDSLQSDGPRTELIRALYLKCAEMGVDTKMELHYQSGEDGSSLRAQATLAPQLGFTLTCKEEQPKEAVADLQLLLPWLQGSARVAVTWPAPGRVDASLRAHATDRQGTARHLHLDATLLARGTSSAPDFQLQLGVEGALRFQAAGGLAWGPTSVQQWAELTAAGGDVYRAELTYVEKGSHKLTAAVSPGRGKQYSGSLEWLLEPENKELVLELELEKKFSFASQVTNSAEEKGMEVVVFWDKDGDTSKTASFLASTTAEKAQASLVVRQQYVSAEINFVKNGVEGELQWTGGNKVLARLLTSGGPGRSHVEVTLNTPFPGFTTQSAVLDYQRQHDRLNLTGEVLWQEKSIEFSVETVRNDPLSNNSNIGVDIKLTSSFRTLRSASAHLSHMYSHSEETTMKTKLYLEINDQLADITSDWNVSDSKTEGTISLQSPWKYVQSATAKLKLVNSDILSLFFVDVQWNSNVNATIEFSYDTKLSFHANFKAAKPLRRYGGLSAEILLTADDSIFMLGTHTTMLPYESSLQINRKYDESFRMSGLLSTPMLKKWEFDIASESRSDGKIMETLDVKKDGSSIVRFDVHGKVVSLYRDTEMYITAQLLKNVFTGLFINYAKSTHSNSTLKASWNNAILEANISGVFTKDVGKVLSKYDAVFSSTLLKEDLKLTMSTESERGKYVVFLQVPGITSISYNFISKSSLNWEIMFQLNSLHMNGSIEQRLVYSPKSSLFANFAAKCNGEGLVADYHYTIDTMKQSIVSNLVTPWTKPIHLDISMERSGPAINHSLLLEYGAGEQVNLEGIVMYTFIQCQVQFQLVSPFTAPLLLNVSYSTQEGTALAIVHWGSIRTEVGLVSYTTDTSFNCKLHVLTPFKSWENVTLNGSYDTAYSGPKFAVSVRRNSDTVALSGLVSLTPQDFHIYVKLTSTFIKFKSISMDCRGDKNNFDLVYEHNGRTIELTGKYQFHYNSNGSVEVRLKSPSQIVGDLGMRLWYDLEHISAGFVAHKNSKQVQAVVNSDERRTEIQITSPFEIIEESSISVRHEYIPGQKLRVNIVLNYNTKTLHAAGYISKPDNNSISASLEVRTPFTDFEKLRMDYSFAGLLEDKKKSVVTLSRNDERLDIDATLNIVDNQQVDIEFKIDTPLVGYESIVSVLSYNIATHQAENGSIEVEGKLLTSFKLAGNKKEIAASFITGNTAAYVNISTSFKSFESASISVSAKYDSGKLSTNFEAAWNEYMLSGNLSSELGLLKSDTQLQVATSLQGFKDIMFGFRHDLLEKEKSVNTYILLNGWHIAEVNIFGFNDPEFGQVALLASTPINFIGRVFFNGNYNLSTGSNKEFCLKFDTDKYKLGIRVTNNQHQTTVQIETPLERFQNVILTCTHKFQLPAVISFTLKNGKSQILFDTSLSVTQNNVVLKFISPFKPYKKFEIVSDLQKIIGQEPGFLLSLTMLENSENILATKIRLTLDWTNKIGINITKQTPDSKEICISAWITPEFPPSHFHFVATKERKTLTSFEWALNYIRDGGFTFRSIYYAPNITRDMILRYYPKDVLIEFTSDMGVLFDKAISFHAELNYDKEDQSLNVISKIVTDGNEKKFLLSCIYDKHHILAELTTPIYNFEKITVEGHLSVEKDNSKAFNISAYKNDQGININLLYNLNTNYSKVLISAEVPFFLPGKLSLDFQHDFRDTKKTAYLNILVGSQLFTADGLFSLVYLSNEIYVKINTPFDCFKHVSFESKYDFSTTATKEFKLIYDVNDVKIIELLFGVDHTSVASVILYINGPEKVLVRGNYDFTTDVEYYIVESSVAVSSQIFDFSAQIKKDIAHGEVKIGILNKESELQWKYENTPSTKKFSTRLIFNTNITYCFDAMFNRHETTGVEASIGMHLPYSQSYVAHTRWDIFHAANPAGNIVIKWPEDQHIAFESSLALGSIDDPVVFIFTGNSSLQTYGELHYETKITISDSFRLESLLDINRQNVFSVNLDSMYSHLMSYISYTLKSPFSSPLYGRFGYDFVREKKTISGELNFGSLKILTLASANFMARVNFEANLEITAPNMRLSKLHFHSILNFSKLKKNAELLLENGDKLWKLSFNQHSKQGFSLAMHTPVSHFEDVKLVARVSTSSQEPANLEITVGKFLAVTAMCLKSQNAIKFSVKGKFDDYEPVGFEGILTTGDAFHYLLTATFNKKEIVLNIYIDFKKQKNTITVESILKCPWMEDVTVVGHFIADGENDSQITVTRGKNISTAKGNLKYFITPHGYNMALTLFLNDMKTTITAEIERGENVNLHLRSKMDPYNFDLKLSHTADSIVGHVSLHTPHTFLRDADGSIEMFSGTMEEPHVHLILSLRLDDRLYMMSTNTVYSTDFVSSNFTLLTPDLKIENNKFMVTLKEDLIAFECQMEDTRVTARMFYKISWPLYSINLTLDLPNYEINHTTFSFYAHAQNRSLSVSGKMQSTEIFSFVTQVIPKDFILNLQTKFQAIPDMSITSKFKNDEVIVHKLYSTLKWKTDRISLETSSQIHPSNSAIRSLITWGDVKKLDISASYLATGGNSTETIETAFLLSTPGGEFQSKLEIDLRTPSTIIAHLVAVTPFHTIPDLTVVTNFHRSSNSLRGYVSLTSRNKTLSVRIDTTAKNMEIIDLRTEVYVPIKDMPPVELTVHIQQKQWTDLSAYIRVHCFFTEGHANFSYQLQGSELNGIIVVDTPLITKEVLFGGSVQHIGLENAYIEGYIDTSKVTISFTSKDNKENSLECHLHMPPLNLKHYALTVRTARGSSKHIHVIYKTDDHIGNASLSLEVTPRNISLEAQIQLPIFSLSRYLARVSVEGAGSGHFVELRYEHGDLTDVATLMFSNDRDLRISGYIQIGLLGKKSVNLEIDKNFEKLVIDIWKAFQVTIKRDPMSGSININAFGQKHSLLYEIHIKDNFKGSVYVESPYIKNEKLSISATSDRHYDSSITEVDIHSGDQYSKTILQFTSTGNTNDMSVRVTFNSKPIITSAIRTESTKQQFIADASLIVFDMMHKVFIRHSKLLAYDSEFKISSPYLPEQLVRGLLNMQNKSINAYVGCGSIKFVPLLAVEAAVDSQNGSAYVNIESEMLAVFKLLSVNSIFKFSDGRNIVIAFDGQFLSEILAEIKLSGSLILNEKIFDASVSAESSLMGSEKLGCSIRLPLSLSSDFNPYIMVTLPNGQKYGFNLVVLFLSDKMELGVRMNFKTDIGGLQFVTVYGSQGKLELGVDMPALQLNHFRIGLQGYRTLADGKDTSNFVEWNENRIELKHTILLERDKAVLHLGLLTPFENHSNYDVKLHFENRQSKVASILFTLPTVGENIGIHFDLMFYNLLDCRFFGEINLPISEKFETVSISIINRVEGHEINCSVAARYNEEEFEASLTTSSTWRQFKFDAFSRLNENNLSLRLKADQENYKEQLASLELITPFAILSKFGVYTTSASNPADGVTANIIYNEEEFLDLILEKSVKGVRSVTAKTPWRSVSSTIFYILEGEFMVNGEFCWDVDKKEDSVTGLEINLRPRPENRLEVSTRLKIPTRTVLLNATYQVKPNRVEYINNFSWEEGHNLGCHILLEMQKNSDSQQSFFLLRGDLPFRSFEVNTHSSLDSSSGIHLSAEVLWDALKDRTKKMQVFVDATTRQTEILFHHPGLQSNLVLRIFKNERFRFELEYSPIRENMFIAETYSEFRSSNGNTRNINAVFLVQHNASSLNLHFGLEAIIAENEVSGALAVQYMDSHRGEIQILHLSGGANYEVPMAEIHVRTNGIHIFAGLSTFTGLDGSHGLRIKTNVNQKQPLSVEVRLNTVHPLLELEVRCGKNRSYSMYMGLPNRRQIVLGARHILDGVQTVDGLVMVSLNSSRLLWTKVQWRYESLNELGSFLRHEYGDLPAIASSVAQSFNNFLEEDFAGKFAAVYTPVSDAISDLKLYIASEIEDTYADVRAAFKELRSKYLRNDFYLMSIFTFFEEKITFLRANIQIVDDLLSAASFFWSKVIVEPFLLAVNIVSSAPATMQTVLVELQTVTAPLLQRTYQLAKEGYSSWRPKEVLRETLEATRRTLLEAEKILQEALSALDPRITAAIAEYSQLTEPYVEVLEETSRYISDQLEILYQQLQELLDAAVNSVVGEREVEMLLEMYEKYASWLEELHLQGQMDQLQELTSNSSKAALGTVEETLEACKQRLSSALASALRRVSELAHIPEVAYLTDIATFLVYKAQWAWQYYEVADSLKEGLHNAAANVDALLADVVHALGQSTAEESGWRAGTLVVRPGLVEFAQELPVDWPGFDETPRFQQLSLNPLSRSQRLIEEPTASLPASPRSTTALLVGGRRFVTFDGKFFDFVGNCSYVLAADLEDSQYFVFITYRGQEGSTVRKSLTVVVDERRVELSEDGQVRVGGKKTELPAAAGTSALLWRRGDSVVVDALRHGLRLRCDLRRDACSLQVGDRHRGKVSGLLGAFHGDVADHARRWRLSLDTTTGDRCEQSGPEESRSPTEEPQLVNACDDLFRSLESPLRPCYGMVDPSPFYAMCLVDATEGPCPSSTVYLAQCRAAGVRVDLPPECVRCALQDGSTLRAGEGKVLDPERPEVADVVFVVERTSCLAKLSLPELTEKLYAGMALRGLEKVHYAIVSFGPGQPPESHTSQGRLWSSHRSVRDTLRTLTFSNSRADGERGSNAVEALQYATRLGFREGASRTVVLVQCSGCSGDDGYGELVTQLLSQGAALHVLEPDTIHLANNRSSTKASKVYGLDSRGAYTGRNVRTLEPSPALRRQVKLPKEQCSAAALETGGTLFNVARLFSGPEDVGQRRGAAKKFLDVWARRVSATATPARCQRCACRLGPDGVGQTFCEDCPAPAGMLQRLRSNP